MITLRQFKISLVVFSLAFCASQSQAQSGTPLRDLLGKVQQSASAEAERNREREARFRAATEEREEMLRAAEAEVARQEARRDSLRERFDSNDTQLGELQLTFDRRAGGLGELFGVFRQTAGDAESVIFSSLISLEHPDRKNEISALAESTEVPTIAEMRKLWELLIGETVRSGEITRFQHEVIDPDGSTGQAEVIRVGTFNVISGNSYLNYLPENGNLVKLSRQPAGYVRSTAANLSNASPGDLVTFTIDPSRGALLGLLVQSPSLGERIEQGGTVGYAIIGVGIVGLLIVLERLLQLLRMKARMARQLKNLDAVDQNNPIGRVMTVYYENKHLDLETISRKLQEVVIKDMAEVRKGLPVVKVLAAVAPLMGLLGTVVGMIGTFQAITLFGTGDPKLMAGGISQALITTVLGLCAAIPLLLSHSMLSARVTQISKVISEQAAGLMAKKAESDALKA